MIWNGLTKTKPALKVKKKNFFYIKKYFFEITYSHIAIAKKSKVQVLQSYSRWTVTDTLETPQNDAKHTSRRD